MQWAPQALISLGASERTASQGLRHPIAPQPAPQWAGHMALLTPDESAAVCNRSTHTHTEPHVLHEQSARQCFSGSDFIWSETLMQDLVVFIYFSLCFLVLDNIFAAAKGWWLPLLSRLSPESLLSMVSIVTIWILHFRRRADEWSPRSWSHYNEHGAENTAKFTSTAH